MNQGPRDLRTKLTRRRLLSGMGSLAVILTSPIWRPATAFGQDAGVAPKKRFIGLFSANGTIPSAFFPAGTAADAPLTLGPILAPLEKHKSRLLVLKGVHMSSANVPQPGGPHMKGPGAMLTAGKLLEGSFPGAGGPAGYADRISVDQHIANRIGTATTFRSLEFGVRVEGGGPLEIISYRDSNQPNTAIEDPWQMYSRIFANGNVSSTQLAKLIAERKSVLDFLKDDIGRLKGRVSASDRARLDAHLTGISGIEQQLGQSKAACTPLTMPAKFDHKDIANFDKVSQLQIDLMILAHACGLTQVSTLMWANADSWQYFPFAGVNEEHHTLSHAGDSDTAATDKLIKINTWHTGQVAYVLDKLAATTEVGGGTMLDNTVLLWGNELGVGNSHTYQNIPWVVAGGGGYFRTGRYLQYKDQNHNNLLVSMCHAMGLTDTTTFGIPELCTGPLSGLT
ncbi:MAG TPA: DUF1552 domain-containing protein [Polyangiaceae bacterium]|nr:DUF1552 domain-containing protein [Polyangiaceae bacterium]